MFVPNVYIYSSVVSLENCAVSVSLSPTSRHLLVGLTSRTSRKGSLLSSSLTQPDSYSFGLISKQKSRVADADPHLFQLLDPNPDVKLPFNFGGKKKY